MRSRDRAALSKLSIVAFAAPVISIVAFAAPIAAQQPSATIHRDAATIHRDAGTIQRDAATIQRDAATIQRDAATIHRDAWGVPHVFSDTDAGALFGMAWALAEDDWPLIEQNYLSSLGRSAELNGEAAVARDWMARALRIVPLSIAEYETATPRMRTLLDAYAAGVNEWLASRPAGELRVLDRIEPWYPLALIRYKYYLNEFLGYAGLRDAWVTPLFERSAALASGPAVAPRSPRSPGDVGRSGAAMNDVAPHSSPGDVGRSGAATHDVAPHTDARDHAVRYSFTLDAQLDAFGMRPHGSNQWAIAPSLTMDGATMLLINPHQSFVGVQRYAEIHLDSREGLRFSGLTVFGFLLPYAGNNDRLGWSYTDNYADHSDLYGIAFDDASQPLRYRYDGAHRTAETWDDSVRVRTDDGMDTRTFRFWSTHHGPIVGIADDGRPLAVASPAWTRAAGTTSGMQ